MTLFFPRPIWLLAIGLLLGACSTSDSVSQDALSDTSLKDDSSPDIVSPDGLLVPEAVEEEDLLPFDFATDQGGDAFDPCLPGEGCLLDPCDDNGQCLSGWCVEHMGEGVCTQLCQEECPPGWSCRQAGTGPDLASICVSNVSNLCKPCVTTEGCKAPGGAEDVCVDYGQEGSYCGGACAADEDCPWGFSCLTTVTVDGISTEQCVADAGVCPCTQKAVELSLWTPCEVANDFGSCEGKRYCTEEGLSGCDALSPLQETCNGLDDDCDGESDEPVLLDGKYMELCDDGNPCTVDLCKGETGCQHTALTEGECVDGDACTIGDHCDAGFCVGLPIACDDDNPCTDDVCDGLGGCTSEFNQATCDDGDPCTVADQCKAGQCGGYEVSCECGEDADCSSLDDGDLCNGTLYCDQEGVPFQCKLVPGSVIACNAPQGTDAPCQASLCDAESGECELVPANEGFACDDGDACTVGDHCGDGICLSGVPAVCKDDNLCTDDSCDPVAGCMHLANSDGCNDGDACTVGDQCVDGVCVGGDEQVCDDGNICTDDACDPVKGCVHLGNDGECDDGNACTTGDYCDEGLCVSVGMLSCDDENICTSDQCFPVVGCQHSAIAGPCDDGNPCTAGDLCINGVCISGDLLDCDDGNHCTDDLCDEAGQCQHIVNDSECDDGNSCTKGDHCVEGACTYGALLDCDDDNVCTTDACDPLQGCLHLLNDAPCSDDNLCTTGDYCSLGECVAAGTLVCADGNPCTDDTCNPDSGCAFEVNSVACDDGSVCTVNDICEDGWCVSGPALDCDDDNLCTDDSCDSVDGCSNADNLAPCDDGNACTASDACADGACVPGDAVVCEDTNPCTDDSCDEATGCEAVPNVDECDDGVGCTVGDKCSDGVCAGVSCADEGMVCWQGGCVTHYCSDGSCDQDETFENCPADCTLDPWIYSAEIEWYPIKYPHDTWSQSQGVSVCKNSGLRLWRDEVGSLDHSDWLYDTYSTHNLGGHDIGYKVQSACAGQQEGHTGVWAMLGKEWSDSIKQTAGASNGDSVYILNKQHHGSDYPTTASYTIVKPEASSVTYVGAYPSDTAAGMTRAVVLCAKRK